MNNLVNFIIESAISLAFLSGLYALFLRRETFFRMNRWFLMGSVVFSVMLPLLKIRVLEPRSNLLPEITVTPYSNLIESVTVYGHDFTGNVQQAIISAKLLIIIYLTGVAVFLFRFLFQLVQISILIRNNEVRNLNGYKLVILEKDYSPFSFLNYVFISRKSQFDGGYERMMAHEAEHVKQGHSLDVIILEILTVFQWFNPFMWLLRKAIRENHEFLADQAVLQSGVSPVYYKHLLISQVVGFQPEIANNFNSSLIKNRIKMLSKIKSSNYGKLKLLLGLIVIFGLVTAFSLEEKKDKKPKEKNLILSLDDQVFRNTEDLNFVTGVMNSKLSVEEKKAKLQERYKLDYRYGVYGVSWKTDPEKAIYFFDGKEIPYEEQKRLQENKMISMSTSITPNREEYEVFYEKYGERVKNGIYILLPESDRDIFFPKEAISQTKPTIESVIEKFTKNRYSEIKLRKNRINIDANGKKFIITGEDVSTNDVINILKGGKYEITITGEKSLKLTQLSNTPLEATTIVKPTLEKGKQVFFIVEEMPEFPGGESALRKFIAETVKYPVEAQKNKIQGKVYVTFVVDSEGNVTDSKIARGVDPSLDMEALRVVGLLPKWKPGLQKGKPVAVSYTVPINFVLN